MRYFLDLVLKGHALLFDGPLDVIEHARNAHKQRKPNHYFSNISINSPGRSGRSWDDALQFLHDPWPEAVKLIRGVVDKVMTSDLPQPKSLKRRPRWDDMDGDIDCDRAMHGEPEYMRRVKRAVSTGPFHIALLGNLDSGTAHRCNKSGVFFRSACCIALADVLENLGYTVEVWIWNRGIEVFPKPNDNQFAAFKAKTAGLPVDFDAMCDAMSSWFTSYGILGSISASPVPPVERGSVVEPDSYTTDVTKCGIGRWLKYLDIGQDVIPFSVPLITGFNVADGYDQAVTVAKQILEKVVNYQPS